MFNLFKKPFYPFSEVNIELISKCALACPRCDRTLEKGNFKQTQLSLADIKKSFDKKVLDQLKRVDLSGNYGDPIYHNELLDILRFFKEHQVSIYLETNASGRSSKWWKEFFSIVDKNDEISFSIDGLEDTNAIYRIGSKWETILHALDESMNSNSLKTWKFIIFKHNQHQIEKVKALASKYEFNQFKLVKSHLFGKHWGGMNDELIPDVEFLNKKVLTDLGISKEESNKQVMDAQKEAKCQSMPKHFISAEGIYSPCCWMNLTKHRSHSVFNNNDSHFHIKENKISDILRSSKLSKLKKSWNSSNCPPICSKKCFNNVLNDGKKTSSSHVASIE